MFLLDDSSPISWLALLNYRATTVVIGSLAHGNTGSHRAGMHTDFVCDSGRRESPNRSRDQYILPHGVLLLRFVPGDQFGHLNIVPTGTNAMAEASPVVSWNHH
jgi:hypothetical protein